MSEVIGMHLTLRRFILINLIALLVPAAALWFVVTQPMLPDQQVESSVKLDPARLEAHVRMLSETLFPRAAGSPEDLDRAAAYIRSEFENTGARVLDQPFEIEGSTFRNVIAHFGPETEDRIVIGAHYDTFGKYPGADDNASGIAWLIELAYLLKDTPLKTHVELVAYTLEEPPYFGSRYMGSAIHAASLRQQRVNVRVMIALEMIGYFTDAEGSQQYPASLLEFFYPSKGNFIGVVSKLDQTGAVRRVKEGMRRSSPLPVYSMNAPALMPGVDFSDHRSYWEAGYEAVMITDTAFFRNPNYHMSTDTPDTLDYKRMAMVVQGVYGLVRALDN